MCWTDYFTLSSFEAHLLHRWYLKADPNSQLRLSGKDSSERPNFVLLGYPSSFVSFRKAFEITEQGFVSWATELDISDSNSSHNPCNRARIQSNRHTVPGPPEGVIGLLQEISKAGIL